MLLCKGITVLDFSSEVRDKSLRKSISHLIGHHLLYDVVF
jgi:hypothetical protein